MLQAKTLVKAQINQTYRDVLEELADSEQAVIRKDILKVLKRASNKGGLAIGSFRGKGMKWDNDSKHKNALESLVIEGNVYAFETDKGITKYVHRIYHKGDK